MNQPQSIGPFQFIGQVFSGLATTILTMLNSTNKAMSLVDKGIDIADQHADLALARAKVSTRDELAELEAQLSAPLVIESKPKAA